LAQASNQLIERAYVERECRDPLDETGQSLVISDKHVRQSCGNGVVNVTNILRAGLFAFECLRIEKREGDPDRDLHDLDFQKTGETTPLAVRYRSRSPSEALDAI
jgi:hypothetical protein